VPSISECKWKGTFQARTSLVERLFLEEDMVSVYSITLSSTARVGASRISLVLIALAMCELRLCNSTMDLVCSSLSRGGNRYSFNEAVMAV
jgi:hypothetical protein